MGPTLHVVGKDPGKGKLKTNNSRKVHSSSMGSKPVKKSTKVASTLIVSTLVASTTMIAETTSQSALMKHLGKSKMAAIKSIGGTKLKVKTKAGSAKVGSKHDSKLSVVRNVKPVVQPSFASDNDASAKSNVTNYIPRMPDHVKAMIVKAVTQEVKNGLNLGQPTVTTTITLPADYVHFLGPTMSREYRDGPLKTVLKDAILGEYKKKLYKVTLLSMNYVSSGGGYLRMTISYKRM